MRLSYTLLYMLGCSAMAFAQDGAGTDILVKEKNAEKLGSDLVISMKVDISNLKISGGQSLVCTPLVESGDSVRALPSMVINGRSRHILYQRLDRDASATGEVAVRRRNNTEQTIDYMVRTPYADWMEKADVSMVMDDCGCGWKELSENKNNLFTMDFSEPVVIDPVLAYIVPDQEAIKARHLDGSAFLDFPVNKTEIYPEYRKNPQELNRIRETIEVVRGDKYASITGISIKGYASPEGTYKNNAYLAEHRAKSLADYVKKTYGLSDVSFSIDFEPEDWAGLEKAVENGNLQDKDEILAIIRADEPADWDAREWKLKALNGGASYKVLLQEVYPGLRHSDYRVDYTIRSFTVDEAKEIIYTDPSKLSLSEMFAVAQQYDEDSEQFGEVFEIAVRMYPNDPVSNLNAAVNAVNTRQLDKAKRYLAKAADCPQKQLVRAAILMLEGKMDEAKNILDSIRDKNEVKSQVEVNLEMVGASK